MNRNRLLADAKARALRMVEGYVPPKPAEYVLPGRAGRVGFNIAAQSFFRRGIATAHDLTVADALAEVLTGGAADIIDVVTEEQLLDIERAAFMRLVRTGPTLARIEHMLDTGKPLQELATGHRLMQTYKAPLRDMRFVLHELHDSYALAALPGWRRCRRN